MGNITKAHLCQGAAVGAWPAISDVSAAEDDGYDPVDDGMKSWELAISELRLRFLRGCAGDVTGQQGANKLSEEKYDLGGQV